MQQQFEKAKLTASTNSTEDEDSKFASDMIKAFLHPYFEKAKVTSANGELKTELTLL